MIELPTIDLIRRLGEAQFEWLLAMSIQLAILVGMVACIDRYFMRNRRAALRYALWSIVLLRCFLPVSLPGPTRVSDWLPERIIAMARIAPTLEQPRQHTTDSQASQSNVPSEKSTVAPENAFPWKVSLATLWAIGVLLISAKVFRRLAVTRRVLHEAEPASEDVQSVLRQCLHTAGLGSKAQANRIRIVTSNDFPRPAIAGLRNATIVIPKKLLAKLGTEQLRLMVMHEVVHWRRWDLQLHALQSLFQIAFFFHPAAWISARMLDSYREQAVDDSVLALTSGTRREYGCMLLDVAESIRSQSTTSAAAIGIFESRKALVVRIRRIMQSPVPERAWLGAIELGSIALAAGILLPVASPTPTHDRASQLATGRVDVQLHPAVVRLLEASKVAERLACETCAAEACKKVPGKDEDCGEACSDAQPAPAQDAPSGQPKYDLSPGSTQAADRSIDPGPNGVTHPTSDA